MLMVLQQRILLYPTHFPTAKLQTSCPAAATVLSLSVIHNTELDLNDLKIIICFIKSDVTVERLSVCNVIEKLMEHDIHCVPCSYTNGVIDLLP